MKKFIKIVTGTLICLSLIVLLICCYFEYEYYKYRNKLENVSPMGAAYYMYDSTDSKSKNIYFDDKEECKELVYGVMYDLNVNHEINDKNKGMIKKDQIINLCNMFFAEYHANKKAYESYLNKNNYKEYIEVSQPKCILSDGNKFILYNKMDCMVTSQGQDLYCGRIEIEKVNNDKFKIVSVIRVDEGISEEGYDKVIKDYKLFKNLK